MFGGLDHNFALFGRGYRKCAALTGNITGIKMNMYTDRPAVQVYTANHIKTDRVYKDKSRYKVHGGICLETQAFPNNLKFSHQISLSSNHNYYCVNFGVIIMLSFRMCTKRCK